MTISNIPFHEIAKRLDLKPPPSTTAPKLLLNLQGLLPQGPLESLPKHILDRIISFLDEKSTLCLRITSVACRCIVRENLVLEARLMIRFFDQVSYKIAYQPEESIEIDMNLAAIGKELAMRGDFEKAKEKLPSSSSYQSKVLEVIALQQAQKGELLAGMESLRAINDDDLLIEAYANVAYQLTKNGFYDHGYMYVICIPLPAYQAEAQRAYRRILSAQVERGNDQLALELAACLIKKDFQSGKDQFYIAIAEEQVWQGNYEHALVTLEKIEHPENKAKARTCIEQVHTRQLDRAKAWANPEAISDPGVRNFVYDELVLHHLKKGQLNTALEYFQLMIPKPPRDGTCIHLSEALSSHNKLAEVIRMVDLVLKPENKDEIYAMIAPAQVKQGDFLRCLHTLDQISNSAIQVQAYQKVVTALLPLLNTKL